jgi:glycosyltransferase involved in cell wall biosynthesis
MQVWFEATSILNPSSPQQAGVPQYTKNMLEALLAIDSKNNYSLCGNLFFTTRPCKFAGRYRPRLIRYIPGRVWNQLIKRRLLPPINLLVGSKPDVVIFPNYVRLPVSPGIRTLTTIHDLGFIKYPEYITPQTHAFLKGVGSSISKSSGLITISESTKRDMIEHYQLEPEQITVIPPAVDLAIFKPTKPTVHQRERYNLPNEYLLFFGTLEPRKNVQGLIYAYKALPSPVQSRYALVLAGGRGWLDQDIHAAIMAYDGPGKIIMTGFVADEDRAAVYSGATLFIYPSFYEGFGMPVVEAMACGVPVITSDNSSLPEAAGGAAILVEATNTQQLAREIKRILSSQKTLQHLRSAGLKRAKLLSWEKSAQTLQRLIEKVGYERA